MRSKEMKHYEILWVLWLGDSGIYNQLLDPDDEYAERWALKIPWEILWPHKYENDWGMYLFKMRKQNDK